MRVQDRIDKEEKASYWDEDSENADFWEDESWDEDLNEIYWDAKDCEDSKKGEQNAKSRI